MNVYLAADAKHYYQPCEEHELDWKMAHFWRENYFNELLKRLETNSDVDETVVELDKKRYCLQYM